MCGLPLATLAANSTNTDTAVAHLDHSHSSQLGNGEIRGALHPGCNMLLGKLENNFRRNKVEYKDLPAWLIAAANYITAHRDNPSGIIHNSERSKLNKIKDNKKVIAATENLMENLT